MHAPTKAHEETRGMAFPVHTGRAADQASQPCAYQPQNHGQDETHVVVTRHYRASQQAPASPTKPMMSPKIAMSDHR
jgi:hypothetical protein